MTKRIHLAYHRRPRRRLGEILRALLRCPLCENSLDVVAYRANTVRLACENCGLRFSVVPTDVAQANQEWTRKENEPEYEDEGSDSSWRDRAVEMAGDAHRVAVEIAILSLCRPGQTFQQRASIDKEVRDALKRT